MNDYCRLCKCVLKRKFGGFEKIEYISTENLFKGPIRAPLENRCRLSDKVCKACCRKIRNVQAVQKQALAIN